MMSKEQRIDRRCIISFTIAIGIVTAGWWLYYQFGNPMVCPDEWILQYGGTAAGFLLMAVANIAYRLIWRGVHSSRLYES